MCKTVKRGLNEALGFPVAQMVQNLPAMQETWVQTLGLEDPLEKGMQPTPVFLPGESHGQRSLAGYSPQGRKGVGHDLLTKQQQNPLMFPLFLAN